MNLLHAIPLVAALSAAGAAQAARAIDAPPPARAAVLNSPQPDAAAQADDSSSLREGRVDDIRPQGGSKVESVFVNGSWLRLAEGSTTLFRQGRPVQTDVLSKGQRLRFTLLPGAADRKTLGVVYVP